MATSSPFALQTDRLCRICLQAKRWLTRFRVSPDGRTLVSGYSDGSLMISMRRTDQAGWTAILTHRLAGEVDGIAISSDGKTFAVSSKPTSLSFWSIKDFKLLREITLPSTAWKLAMRFEPGRLAVGTWDRSVRIWDTSSILSNPDDLDQILELGGHTQLVTGEAFDSTGSLLASISMDGDVRLWDVSGADRGESSTALTSRRRGLLTIDCHPGDPGAIAFLPCAGGDALAVGLSSGKVLIWERGDFAPSFDGHLEYQQGLRHASSIRE